MDGGWRRIKGLIQSIQTGKITVEQLTQMQRKLDETKDVLDEETGDEEVAEGWQGRERTDRAQGDGWSRRRITRRVDR